MEYVRRLSPAWRVYVGVEGQLGEASLITDVQWHFSRFAFLRVNNGFALTATGSDWAPEVGVVLTRRRR